MKKSLLPVLLLATLVLGVSCKKLIEQKQKSLIMDAITNGTWYVEQYFEGENNISSDFLNYDFQFYTNSTVTGTHAGTVDNGTWSANTSDYTITSQFPAAADPVKKLNGVWKITDSYWDYVRAEQMVNGVKNTLYLRKKA